MSILGRCWKWAAWVWAGALRNRLRVGVATFVVIAVGLVTTCIDPLEWRLMSAAEREDASLLKQIGMVFKIYAGDNHARFPPATTAPEFGLPDVVALKQYMRPEPVERITSRTKPRICYLGYLLVDEAPARALFDAWQKAGAQVDLRSDVVFKVGEDYGPYSTERTVMRLKKDSERFLIRGVNETGGARVRSAVPILWEMPTAERLGGFVMFMDGHVEWMPYPGPFPMAPGVIDALRYFMKEPGAEYTRPKASPVYELACRINAAVESEVHRWYEWDIEVGFRVTQCDVSPSVVAGDARGYRIVLSNIDTKMLLLSRVRVRRYRPQMEFVLFPEKEPGPDTAAIPWTLRGDVYGSPLRRAYLGDGCGFHWFSNATGEAEVLIKGGILVKSKREPGAPP